ncbi:imelysin family protein [Aquimarina sp. MMG016]|uniref:imelysin family protein n=1 Tax=Aquimarina sp. MMG016 TaxID=2822690 RepID=UPI001B3A4033|nr:imelysin family protein [Aquimarina sp. MMG016]MBQ4822786.1 imelysin family protein [Aquimarina sp. MMG016]
MKKLVVSLFIMLLILVACTSGDDSGVVAADNFDRKAMLENLADNIIIPSYQGFSMDMSDLTSEASKFITTPNEANLISLRSAWSKAYISWQSVGMFEIGKAEEFSYRNFMNVYPVSSVAIDANINSGSYDLSAVSKQDEQGFGALDYLLNGLADTDAEIVTFYTTNTNASNYITYLTDLTTRMDDLTKEVVLDWINGYRDTFVNNSGSSATSSLDKLVNDYIFHYEKHLRAGKVGIPAGVFTGNTASEKVEAFYKGDLSKTLFNANLDAMQNFFNGKHFSSNENGESFKTYLDYLVTLRGGKDIATLINNQFNVSRTTASGLNDNFSNQVRTNNVLMTETYNVLQKNVVFMKVDMLSSMSVRVDFVDADGD